MGFFTIKFQSVNDSLDMSAGGGGLPRHSQCPDSPTDSAKPVLNSLID